MAWRCFPRAPLVCFLLHHLLIVSATTTVYFYADAFCNDLYATVQTDSVAGGGQCGEFGANINSAKSGNVNPDCSVTTYTDDCTSNATTVPVGACTGMRIATFSVDCPPTNGTYEPGYTTALASDMSARSSLSSSTSTSSTSSPVVPVSSNASPFSSSSSSTTLPPSSSTTLPPSSSPFAPPQPSASASPKSNGSGNDGGLSGPSTIALDVVVPCVGVVVAIFFGVMGLRRWRHMKENGQKVRETMGWRRWSW